MIQPADIDLRAYRGVPFIDVTAFEGQDYASATFTMELRRFRDAPGDPLVALANAVASAQGISCSIATDGGVLTSAVRIQINETTIEGLAKTSPAGGDLELAYALDVTGGGLGKHRRMQGRFIVEASANG